MIIKIAIQGEYAAFLYIFVKGRTMMKYHMIISKGMSIITFKPAKPIAVSFG